MDSMMVVREVAQRSNSIRSLSRSKGRTTVLAQPDTDNGLGSSRTAFILVLLDPRGCCIPQPNAIIAVEGRIELLYPIWVNSQTGITPQEIWL